MANYTAGPAVNLSTHSLYSGPKGIEVREAVFDFSKQNCQIADTVNFIPLNQGEWVQNVFVREEVASGSSSATLAVNNSATGGALIPATVINTAGAILVGNGAGMGVPGTVANGPGWIQGVVAAAALTAGKVTVYAVIGLGF